jgi:hypothetical protein
MQPPNSIFQPAQYHNSKKKAEIIKLVENGGETCTNNKQHQ